MQPKANLTTIIMLTCLATACAGHSQAAHSQSDGGRIQNREATTQNTVEYRDSATYPEAAEWMRLDRQFEVISSVLDGTGPHPGVSFVAEDCGNTNAYYQPATHTLRLCYELVALVMEKYGTTSTAHHIIGFALGHELAHAYIHLYNLPVIGREEDAADQLGALLRLAPPSEKDRALALEYANGVVAAAEFFHSAWRSDPAWGEHSMGDARYFNLLCLAYGAVEEIRERIATALPKTRAERCVAEALQAANSWDRLLEGHRN